MANPVYFDWNYWTPRVGTQGAEFLKNLYDRAGGSQTSTTNLVDINTSITTVESSVEGVTGTDALLLFALAEIDRLKRRIETLEADTHGDSLSYA